jgi:hypothetical protein
MKLPNKLTILAAITCAAFTGAFADEPKPGDKVAAQWTDGGYYLATVTGAEGGSFDVLYDDGDKGKVAATDLIAISRGELFNAGDHVLAAWKNARMFPGTVTATTQFTVTVKWDDGDAPLEVARDRVVHLKAAAAQVMPAGALPAGTSVAAKWGPGSFYIATIAGVDANGRYLVNYGDGDKGAVAAGDVVCVDSAREIPIGAHVLACWRGAQMFPGVVTARRHDSYTVKWDDGDTPLEVSREKIAPLSAK